MHLQLYLQVTVRLNHMYRIMLFLMNLRYCLTVALEQIETSSTQFVFVKHLEAFIETESNYYTNNILMLINW